jgi:hypothetical protein
MIILAGFSILLFACLAGALLWSLAVYALPLWCGMIAATWTYGSNAGLLLSGLAGLAAATATLAFGQLLLGVSQSSLLRAGVGLAFATPAAVAGYHAAHGIAAAFGVAGPCASAMALLAGSATGITGWSGTVRSFRKACPAQS